MIPVNCRDDMSGKTTGEPPADLPFKSTSRDGRLTRRSAGNWASLKPTEATRLNAAAQRFIRRHPVLQPSAEDG